MTALLAQAASSGEWHDGWWILIAGVCLAVVGWLLRVLYSGLKDAIKETKQDLNKRCDTIESSLSELRSTLLTDALERARQQPQPHTGAQSDVAPAPDTGSLAGELGRCGVRYRISEEGRVMSARNRTPLRSDPLGRGRRPPRLCRNDRCVHRSSSVPAERHETSAS